MTPTRRFLRTEGVAMKRSPTPTGRMPRACPLPSRRRGAGIAARRVGTGPRGSSTVQLERPGSRTSVGDCGRSSSTREPRRSHREHARPIVENISDGHVVGDAEGQVDVGESVAATEGERANGSSGDDRARPAPPTRRTRWRSTSRCSTVNMDTMLARIDRARASCTVRGPSGLRSGDATLPAPTRAVRRGGSPPSWCAVGFRPAASRPPTSRRSGQAWITPVQSHRKVPPPVGGRTTRASPRIGRDRSRRFPPVGSTTVRSPRGSRRLLG